MQYDQATPWQYVASDLGTDVMEFCKECRREILFPLRVGAEECRPSALVGQNELIA
jgi:hypothetical protein